MKNLALIEIHKLARFQTMQGQAVANIEMAAQDFLDFYPLPAAEDNATPVGILVGAERGFCGDFNESLINALAPKAYLYHDHIPAQINRRQILPPFTRHQQAKPGFGNPPVLNLKPADFFQT